ncbi:hypothetical protein F8O06_02710 [Pseudoclavibacter sp. CFCC 14310]|uniref:hypothetical protein n=1 Tax=Pseudoclavibacter sp. CFCC 14310 TaxID=2615180 RepID=UPI0013017045|nr:hypothetical protein [Pseudoclavibacter sp. CFCC 14310]KAB1647468.1 hypothetical protein F8O06_02710 [Pseudoclavibacter sp. CFCC 14310]
MTEIAQVTLGGIVFDGQYPVHGWMLDDLTDWFSLPDSKAESVARPQAHGSFDPGTDWRAGSVHTLTAGYAGASTAEVERALRTLNGLAGTNTLVRCEVALPSGVTHRMVSIRRIDAPPVYNLPFVTGIKIDLLAPDPCAYGTEVSAVTGLPTAGTGVQFPFAFPADFGTPGDPGRVVFVNEGTAPTPLRFRVSGGMSDGFSLKCIESSDVLTLSRPLPVGSSVTLDSSDGTAMLDGVSPVSGFLTDDDWWQVGPGETCTIQFEALGDVTGSPQLQVTGAPAWF